MQARALDAASYLVPPGSSPSRGHPLPLGYLQERGYSALIEIAFQCMTLMCDSLAALSPEYLMFCISTLGKFGRQAVMNIALTAAKNLFWGLSDVIQAKRCEADHEPAYSTLWMHILLAILCLRADARPEVRIGVIQTLFRTLQPFGATLSPDTCGECVWKVTMPLLDKLSPHVHANTLTPPSSPDATTSAADADRPALDSSSWNEPKVVALQSIGVILNEVLVSKFMHPPSFTTAWETFLTDIRVAFLLDGCAVSAPELRCLKRALKAAAGRCAVDGRQRRPQTVSGGD